LLGSLGRLSEERVSRLVPLIVARLGFDYDAIAKSRQFSFMSYEEIADAARRGLDIQLHSHTHRLSLDYPEQIAAEVELNRSRLAPHVSSPLRHFCFPGGFHSPRMFPYLEACAVASATTVDPGFVTKRSNPYALPRILDGENTTDLEFEAELCGFLELGRRLKRIFAKQ
jgi:peptidoglycan/xylan/chitin deacetylase (PgdA/CDA1 family)